MSDVFLRLQNLELSRTRQVIEAEFREWCRARPAVPLLDDPRRDAISELMKTLFDRETQLAQDAVDRRYAAQLATLRAWTLFRHVLAQRADPLAGEILQRADDCAAAAYLELSPEGPPAPPLVVIDSIDSPVTYARNELVNVPTIMTVDAQRFPIPLVLVPASYLSCPWLLTTAHHEIGHALDRDHKIVDSHGDKITSALEAGGAPLRSRDLWQQWLSEVVADLYGVLASGPAFVWSMAIIFDRLGHWNEWNELDVHPPAPLRIALAMALLERRHKKALDLLAPMAARLEEYRAQRPILAEAGVVAEALLAECVIGPLPDAGADLEVTQKMKQWLLGKEEETPADFVLRLAPAAVQLALLEDVEPGHLVDRAQLLLKGAPASPWLGSPVRWQQVRDQLLATEPALLDEETRRKLPPHRLLLTYERISFVGASHHQLAAALSKAFAERGRPWERIEVFFLDDEGVARMAPGDILALRDRAIAELRALLPEVARESTLYLYNEPFTFGSFWDVDEPRGRIHVSPYVWGEDAALCPGVDYLRNDAMPTAAYATYARGLDALRKDSRRL